MICKCCTNFFRFIIFLNYKIFKINNISFIKLTESLFCLFISVIGDEDAAGFIFSISCSFSCESIDSRLCRNESKEPDNNCEL